MSMRDYYAQQAKVYDLYAKVVEAKMATSRAYQKATGIKSSLERLALVADTARRFRQKAAVWRQIAACAEQQP